MVKGGVENAEPDSDAKGDVEMVDTIPGQQGSSSTSNLASKKSKVTKVTGVVATKQNLEAFLD